MTLRSLWSAAAMLGVASCAISPENSVTSVEDAATAVVLESAPLGLHRDSEPAPAKAAAVFRLVDSQPMQLCSAPILHGLDKGGAKLWSKTFVDGEVDCSETETRGLVQVRVEHPHLALRRPLRYSSAPSRPIQVDCEFFGDCSISLASLSTSDIGAHLVLRRPSQESYLDAVMAGRTEELSSLDDLLFTRLPIGRYEIALFRENPFENAGSLFMRSPATVLPCQETAAELQ